MIVRDNVPGPYGGDGGEESLLPQVQDLCKQAGVYDSLDIEEMSAAVCCFVTERFSGDWIEKRELTRATSKALAALGRSGESQRVLMCGIGGARFRSSAMASGGKAVILDMQEIFRGKECETELRVVQTLNKALVSFSTIWDRTGGRGALVLKHSRLLAGRLGGCRRGRRAGQVEQELRSHCIARLKQLKNLRNWSSLPHVLSDDM